MLTPGHRVGVAVSGGADSVCLLHLLCELASAWNLQLAVLHLNHSLRGAASDEDARFVQALAQSSALPFHSAQIALPPGNLEQAARDARLQFFAHAKSELALDRIALGHTASDQAETVLFRFLRGSGAAGLAAIRPVTRDGRVRPLIEITRSEVENFLTAQGIPWRQDATNRDPAFARNRIRHQLLPTLTRDWNPALAATLANTADWARSEEEYWHAEIDRLAVTHLQINPPRVLFNVDALCAMPVAVARRLLRRAVELVRGNLRGIDFPHIEAVRTLAGAPDGHGRVQIPGVDVYRSFEWIRMAPPGLETLANRDWDLEVHVPGQISLPGAAKPLVLELKHAESVYNCRVNGLDWDRLSGTLQLRNWRPGDQYTREGHVSNVKLKNLFQQERVPLWERRTWPVLIHEGAIVWARLFGPAAGFAASGQSRQVLEIREIEFEESSNRHPRFGV